MSNLELKYQQAETSHIAFPTLTTSFNPTNMDSNTPNIPIKLRLSGKSCRRARIEIPLTMSMVKSKILTSFPELKSGQFTMNYQDEEGDQIEVVNDQDLAEALAVFTAIGRVLSFTICPQTIDSESDDTDDADGSTNHDNDCAWRQHWRQHWRQRSMPKSAGAIRGANFGAGWMPGRMLGECAGEDAWGGCNHM